MMDDITARVNAEKEHRKQDLRRKERDLLSGTGHSLLELPRYATEIKLDDDTGVSQVILEYVASNFLELRKLNVENKYFEFDAEKIDFHGLNFPKLEEITLHRIALDEINFHREHFPMLKSIDLENIVGEIAVFRLDLPTLELFSSQYVELKDHKTFAASISRCTNLKKFSSYKLQGLFCQKLKLFLPNCEEFALYRSDALKHFEIYAPKLLKLNLQACYELAHLQIVDEPFGRPIECFNCSKKEDTSFKRCAKCRIAQYCSKDCQVNHWNSHKDYCGKRILINLVNSSFPTQYPDQMRQLKEHPRIKKIFMDPEEGPSRFMEA